MMTGVPAHTIRFWERDFGAFLRPSRTAGRQRRYGPADIEVIEKIKHLRYEEKYTVAGTVRELARDGPGGAKVDRVADEIARLVRRLVVEKMGRSA